MCASTVPPPHTGDRSPLFVTLVDLLTRDFNLGDESHLVAHPCAHWVVRRLLEGEGGGEGIIHAG